MIPVTVHHPDAVSRLVLKVAGLLAVVTFALLPTRLHAQAIVCFFGDSITEGWMDARHRPDDAYPALLDAMFAAEGRSLNTVVAGVAGETTADALQRIDRDVLAFRPDVVVFAYGSNDYFVRGAPPAPRVPVERFRNNCRALFRRIQESGARLVVLAPPPLLERRFYLLFDRDMYAPFGGAAALRTSYAAALAAVTSEFPDAAFVQVDAEFASDSTLLGFDGVHPQPEGHHRIALALQNPIVAAIASGPVFSEALADVSVHPSPFDARRQDVMCISFHTDRAGVYLLRIHDLSGREVRKIVSYAFMQGNHIIFWDGRDAGGTRVGPGAYTLTVSSAHEPLRMHRLLVL